MRTATEDYLPGEPQTEDYLPGAVRSVVFGCGLVQKRIAGTPVANTCSSHSPWQVVFSNPPGQLR
jgi:hypothetical protein